MASSISTSIRPLVKISHHSNVLDQFDQVVQLVSTFIYLHYVYFFLSFFLSFFDYFHSFSIFSLDLFAAIFDFIDIIDQYMQSPGFNVSRIFLIKLKKSSLVQLYLRYSIQRILSFNTTAIINFIYNFNHHHCVYYTLKRVYCYTELIFIYP